jgi:hypothetical protein
MSNITFKLTEVHARNSSKAGDYLVGKGNLLKKDGTVVGKRTVMVFKENVEAVKKFFKPGRKVTLNCMPQGGSYRVLGLRKDPAPAEAPAEAAAA